MKKTVGMLAVLVLSLAITPEVSAQLNGGGYIVGQQQATRSGEQLEKPGNIFQRIGQCIGNFCDRIAHSGGAATVPLGVRVGDPYEQEAYINAMSEMEDVTYRVTVEAHKKAQFSIAKDLTKRHVAADKAEQAQANILAQLQAAEPTSTQVLPLGVINSVYETACDGPQNEVREVSYYAVVYFEDGQASFYNVKVDYKSEEVPTTTLRKLQSNVSATQTEQGRFIIMRAQAKKILPGLEDYLAPIVAKYPVSSIAGLTDTTVTKEDRLVGIQAVNSNNAKVQVTVWTIHTTIQFVDGTSEQVVLEVEGARALDQLSTRHSWDVRLVK